MQTGLRRISGIFFMVTSAIALILTVLGTLQVWQEKARLTESVVTNLELVGDMLDNSSQGLVVIEETLDTVTTNVDSLQTATDQLAASLHNTAPMLTTLKDMTGVDLPATITATQISLTSAQTSARLIDNMLTTISRIPLIGQNYVPDPPLSESLGQVSENIETLKPTLVTVTQNLEDAETNLADIEEQVILIGDNIQMINENLDDARLIIDEYQVTVTKIQEQIDAGITNAPTWLDRAAWGATFVLVWMMITQLGLFLFGLEHFWRSHIGPQP